MVISVAPPTKADLLKAAKERYEMLTAEECRIGTPGMVVTEILDFLERAGETPESVLGVSRTELHDRAETVQRTVESLSSNMKKWHYYPDIHEI